MCARSLSLQSDAEKRGAVTKSARLPTTVMTKGHQSVCVGVGVIVSQIGSLYCRDDMCVCVVFLLPSWRVLAVVSREAGRGKKYGCPRWGHTLSLSATGRKCCSMTEQISIPERVNLCNTQIPCRIGIWKPIKPPLRPANSFY